MTELQQLVSEFFQILDTVEDSDRGIEFHPTTINSCRVQHVQRLAEILPEMRRLIPKQGCLHRNTQTYIRHDIWEPEGTFCKDCNTWIE